jgi:CheY-like chemotaxis protein
MRLLVIDRDRVSAQLIEQRLQAFGHEIVYEPSKNEALERMGSEAFDMVLVDPAPLATIRPFIISLRRALPRQFIYVALMAHGAARSEAITSGMCDAIQKPLDPDRLPLYADNAGRMVDLVRRLGDESTDYPNSGGILGKSAMNQLFLTSLDRADRYGEQSFMLFVSLRNYAAVRGTLGEDGAEEMVRNVGAYLGKVRRQSDITGRTGVAEFGSLILRPMRETEPHDAAARFSEIMTRDRATMAVNNVMPEFDLRLVNIPTGEIQAKYEIL